LKLISKDTTIDDLLADPHAFGLPTIEEYAQVRDKLWGNNDDAMVALTEGPNTFRRDLKRIIYQVNGLQLASEEEVERALADHGYSLADIDLENRDSKLKKQIEMIPLGGGKYDIVINFCP